MDYEIKKEGKFEYVEAGSGPVLLLLHGLFGALSNFKDVLDHFKSKYTVTIPIMPLYTLPVINTNVKNMMKYIRDFIEHKGYKDVNLLGNSLGGHVALFYVSRHPDMVKSLTLTGSSGLYENPMGSTYPRKGNIDFVREKVAYTFYDPKHATDELVNECFNIVNDRAKALKVLTLARSAIRQNMASELPKFKLPTCLIWGTDDKITPPEVAEEFNKLIPDSTLYWIENCGHAPMMEYPEKFNQVLEPWLDNVNFPK